MNKGEKARREAIKTQHIESMLENECTSWCLDNDDDRKHMAEWINENFTIRHPEVMPSVQKERLPKKQQPKVSQNTKRKNLQSSKSEVEELRALGYTVIEHTLYHWRVEDEEGFVEVDVWPTKKKLMDRNAVNWYSVLYTDLVKAIQDIHKRNAS